MGKADVSERVYLMKSNFMNLHEEGYSIPEIAEKFDLSYSTAYRHLGEIAQENGVTREDLLKIVQSPRSERRMIEEKEKIKLDTNEMLKEFDSLSSSIEALLSEVDQLLMEVEI